MQITVKWDGEPLTDVPRDCPLWIVENQVDESLPLHPPGCEGCVTAVRDSVREQSAVVSDLHGCTVYGTFQDSQGVPHAVRARNATPRTAEEIRQHWASGPGSQPNPEWAKGAVAREETPAATLGGLRTMPFAIRCRVCGQGRPIWASMTEGWLAAHEGCAARTTSLSINVPLGTSLQDAAALWMIAAAERGLVPLGDPVFHNEDIHVEAGIPLHMVGDVARPPREGAPS